MDYNYSSYDDDNPLGEPIDNFKLTIIVPNEDTADYGGQDVTEVEETMGNEQTSDDYLNSNATSVDSLGNLPDPEAAETYTDVYVN